MSRWTRSTVLGVAAAGVVAALHALRVFQAAISDDAYILYRYAAHLASGHGLVWNVGERPIEGFTSLLDVLILAAGHALGFDFVQCGQILGVVFAALACVAAALLGREASEGDTRVAILAAWIVALAPPLAAWGRGGMETSLFTFFITMAIATWMWERRTRSHGFWSSAVFLLAGLARPEAFGIALLAFGFDLVSRRKTWIAWWPFVAGVVIFAIWKLEYFGDLLPNTYYAKTGGGFWALTAGLRYVAQFFRMYGAVGLLLIVVPAVVLPRAFLPRAAFLLAALGLMGAQVAKIGGDYQYFGRYLVPVLPWLAVLTALGATQLWDAGRVLPERRRIAIGTVLALVAGFQLALPSLKEVHDRPWLLTRPWRLKDDIDPALFHPDFEFMGRALADIAEPNETIAALAVGAIGYYSDRPILDCLGLNDREIARLPVARAGRSAWRPGHMKGNARVILSRHPAIMVLPMRATDGACQRPSSSDLATYPFVADLLKAQEFQSGYRLRSRALPDGRWLNYYVREPARALASESRECGDLAER